MWTWQAGYAARHMLLACCGEMTNTSRAPNSLATQFFAVKLHSNSEPECEQIYLQEFKDASVKDATHMISYLHADFSKAPTVYVRR